MENFKLNGRDSLFFEFLGRVVRMDVGVNKFIERFCLIVFEKYEVRLFMK